MSKSRSITSSATGSTTGSGLRVERRFTRPGVHPFDDVQWELRTASITNEKGAVVFEQKDVEIPASWSQMATNVVVSKYFRGQLGTPRRETSVKQLIGRVVDTISDWGVAQGYFASDEDAQAFRAELAFLCVTQRMAFNSPVWFNVGVEEKPQGSACQPHRALISTPDGLIPIGELVERVAIGQPVYDSYGITRVVGVKSNGLKEVYRVGLRNGSFIEATADHLVRAAGERRTTADWVTVADLRVGMRMHLHPRRVRQPKAQSVAAGYDADSPGYETYVSETTDVEVSEAALAGWLQADGFVGQYDHGTNRSLTVEFQTANEDEYAWVIGHLAVALPGIHHKVREHSLQNGQPYRRVRIYGEKLREFVERWEILGRRHEIRVPGRLWTAPQECIVAYLRSVFQADGYVSINPGDASGNMQGKVAFAVISERWTEDIQLLLNLVGIYSRRLRKTEKRTDRSDLHEVVVGIGSEKMRFAELIGFVGRDKQAKLAAALDLRGLKTCPPIRTEAIVSIASLGIEDVYDIQTESGEYLSNNVSVHNCFINSIEDTMESILGLAKTEGMLFKYGSGAGVNLSALRGSMEKLKHGGTASGPVSFMKGFDAFAGAIKSGGATRRAAKMVILNVDHPDIEEFINCKVKEEKKAWALIDAGYDGSYTGEAYGSVFFQNSNNSIRVPDEFMKAVENNSDWHTLTVTDRKPLKTFKARELMRQISDAAWVCGDPGMQYDTIIQDWNCVANTARINATNPCSEFVFIDDTACNLASLNLMKFIDEQGTFLTEDFKHATRITITAQEMIVPNASYPTEKIGENSLKLRPLGLGFANLGALLMSQGLPYDSDEGRAYGAAVTSLMTAEAYAQSARISASCGGPFELFAENREPMLRVMNKHMAASYNIDRKVSKDAPVEAACQAWEEAVALGVKHGYRNAQATVLAPTGCLTGNSLVMTDRGLVRLRSLGDPNGQKWQDLDSMVATDDGPRKATKFYVNGVEPVVTIQTKRGYRIQGTPLHRIRVVDANGDWQWRRLADVRKDDSVPMMLGGMLGNAVEVALPPLAEAHWNSDPINSVPRQMTTDLAELVGYFMGDGSLHSKGLRFCVANTDLDVVDRLVELGSSLFGLTAAVSPQTGYTEVAFHSVRLTLWWEACGFAKTAPSEGHRGKGYGAHIPDAVLHANDAATYGAFLRGLFESDGTVSSGYASVTTVSEDFAIDLQSMLLALGLVSTRRAIDPGTSWGSHPKHQVRLLNVSSNQKFADRVGFISARKSVLAVAGDHPQAARYDQVPVSRGMIDMLLPENDNLRKTMLLSKSRTGMVSRRSAVALMERMGNNDLGEMLGFYYDRVERAELGEEQMTYDLSVPENVTYVANGFVSHNTIAFMMDCDTTGVEPDIALVKYKKLVGGGLLKIVNGTVPRALNKIGYDAKQVDKIIGFIADNDTIEGAPALKPEHLPVFDCAFKPAKGERSIHYMGHLKMVAAAQPFISGSISKTINLPELATVEDIEQAYIDGWKMGLKCISVYRDNCKRSQPLNTKLDDKKAEPIAVATRVPVRSKLPDERQSITHKFDIQGHEGYITVSMFEDRKPGEIFVKMAKEGSTLSGMMDSFAIMVSLSLQYGVPLEALVSKFSHVRFEPSGYTSNPEIPIAKSIVDYIFRWLASKFYDEEGKEAIGIIKREPKAAAQPVEAPKPVKAPVAKPDMASGSDSGDELRVLAAGVGGTQAKVTVSLTDSMTCSDCGAIMVRAGACYKCLNCGSTSGCG